MPSLEAIEACCCVHCTKQPATSFVIRSLMNLLQARLELYFLLFMQEGTSS